ncbi:MAG: SurA N-terminal domain-containing protein [Halanaerobiales bacterium]|nr:SurA N-terminal domain-containing protein [Halanaerobiales bacterium]
MFDNLRNNSKIVVYIVVAAFIVTGGLMGFGSYMTQNSGSNRATQSQYIAQVNDKGITPEQYLSVLRSNASQASNLTQTQVIPFRLNVLNAMIEREILLTEADEMDINVEVTDQEIEEEIDEILEQNDMTKEELEENLSSQEYTYEQFKNDIRLNMVNSKKVNKVKQSTYSNIEVGEEEIKNRYEELYGESEDKPELEEVRTNIKENLLNEKQNQAYNNWLENKKTEANVIINDPILFAYNALDKGNYQVAIDSFKNLIDSENTSVSIYTYLAQAYSGAEQYEQASDIYDTAIEEFSENWELRLNYGDYLAERGQKEQATEQYLNASEQAGSNIYAHYQLFMAFNNIGANDEAEKEMDKISEIQQKSQETEQQTEETEDTPTSIEEEIESNQ